MYYTAQDSCPTKKTEVLAHLWFLICKKREGSTLISRSFKTNNPSRLFSYFATKKNSARIFLLVLVSYGTTRWVDPVVVLLISLGLQAENGAEKETDEFRTALVTPRNKQASTALADGRLGPLTERERGKKKKEKEKMTCTPS